MCQLDPRAWFEFHHSGQILWSSFCRHEAGRTNAVRQGCHHGVSDRSVSAPHHGEGVRPTCPTCCLPRSKGASETQSAQTERSVRVSSILDQASDREVERGSREELIALRARFIALDDQLSVLAAVIKVGITPYADFGASLATQEACWRVFKTAPLPSCVTIACSKATPVVAKLREWSTDSPDVWHLCVLADTRCRCPEISAFVPSRPWNGVLLISSAPGAVHMSASCAWCHQPVRKQVRLRCVGQSSAMNLGGGSRNHECVKGRFCDVSGRDNRWRH